MDLATVLVGRWEGELAQSKSRRGTNPPERTLVINSVTKSDSGWIVNAVYGITGQASSAIQVSLDSTAGAPALSFLTGVNGRVTLRVFDDQNLVGSWTMGGSERALSSR